MQALAFWKTVGVDEANLLERFRALLDDNGIEYCVVGGHPRYADFPQRAQRRSVLGLDLPVAALEDVVRGKVWAAQDTSRRASKHLKDLADLARLAEAHPQVRELIPAELQERLQ